MSQEWPACPGSELPEDAVFVIDNSAEDVAMSGNTAELPALTSRTLFVVRDSHYVVKPYAELARRTRIAEQLFAGSKLADEDARYLAALGRPLFVVDYHTSAAEPDWRERAPVFRSGDVSLHRVALATGARETVE